MKPTASQWNNVSWLVVRNVVEKLTTSLPVPLLRPIDYSLYNHSVAASPWRTRLCFQLESPFNDTLLGRHFSSPYSIMCQDALSTVGESIVEGNTGGNTGGNVGGNVGGPR